MPAWLILARVFSVSRPAGGRCGSSLAGAASSRACRPAWWPGSCGRAVPARRGCPLRRRAGAWRSYAAACAGWFADRARPAQVFGKQPADASCREPAAILVEEDRRCFFAKFADDGERDPPAKPASPARPHRRRARAAPSFPCREPRAPCPRDRDRWIQADKFADAQPGGIERFEHGPVAAAERSCPDPPLPAAASHRPRSGSAAASCPAAGRAGPRPGSPSARPAGRGTCRTQRTAASRRAMVVFA